MCSGKNPNIPCLTRLYINGLMTAPLTSFPVRSQYPTGALIFFLFFEQVRIISFIVYLYQLILETRNSDMSRREGGSDRNTFSGTSNEREGIV